MSVQGMLFSGEVECMFAWLSVQWIGVTSLYILWKMTPYCYLKRSYMNKSHNRFPKPYNLTPRRSAPSLSRTRADAKYKCCRTHVTGSIATSVCETVMHVREITIHMFLWPSIYESKTDFECMLLLWAYLWDYNLNAHTQKIGAWPFPTGQEAVSTQSTVKFHYCVRYPQKKACTRKLKAQSVVQVHVSHHPCGSSLLICLHPYENVSFVSYKFG